MRHLEVQPWEANHPLNGKPCPITGKLPYVEDTWKVSKPDYRLRTGILESGIVLSFPVGYTVIDDTHNFFNILSLIRKSSILNENNFVLIEDYTFHTGSDYEGRLSYIKRMVEEVNPAGIVFITQSVSWKLSIKMAQVMSGQPFPILYVSTYREALHLASEILGRPIAGLQKIVTPDRMESSHFGISIKIGSLNLATVSFSGSPKDADIPSIAEFYQGISKHPKLTGTFTTIHDVSMLRSRSPWLIWKLYRLILSEQCNRDGYRVLVIAKSSLMKSVVFLLKLFNKAMYGKVLVFYTVDAAIKQIDSDDQVNRTESQLSEKLQLQAMEMLDKINWDQPGHYELDIVCNPQLKPLALMLGALKQDVDYYLQERMVELDQLEQKHNRAQQLSIDIELAFRRSEEDRIKTEELSKKNLSLSDEINQSQKEVFLVMADYIDRRAGIREGTTKKIARLAQFIAPFLGYSREDADRLHDATLLYHVGYLGIPENESDSTAHCQVGGELLGNIYTFIMQFAAQSARSHHEKWNGTGFPERLIGDQIPREARLIAIAEFLIKEHSQPLEYELIHEVGKAFDPAMVAVINKHLNEIQELIAELRTV